MSLLESWLHPLRAYPRGFVLACFILSVGPVIWFIAKMAKWSLYTMSLLVFATLTGAFALWLWQ